MKSQLFLEEITDKWTQIYTDLPESRRVKRTWIKRGYPHQASFYGVISEKENEDSQFRRIEVLSNTPYTQQIIESLYHWFEAFIVPVSYSIWIYNKNKRGIALVGKFG